MSQSIQISITGAELDSNDDGDWTITITRDENLVAHAGISGTPADALQLLRTVAANANIKLRQ